MSEYERDSRIDYDTWIYADTLNTWIYAGTSWDDYPDPKPPIPAEDDYRLVWRDDAWQLYLRRDSDAGIYVAAMRERERDE